MDKSRLNHDILNVLERLKIMLDLARDQKFDLVSKEELTADLHESLKKLEKDFLELIQ